MLTSPEFLTFTIVVGAEELKKFDPISEMAVPNASPWIREPAGTKMVLVPLQVPAEKWIILQGAFCYKIVLMLFVSSAAPSPKTGKPVTSLILST
jgi:hypothetical protein